MFVERVGEEEQALSLGEELLSWTLYCLSESPLHISLALEDPPWLDFFSFFLGWWWGLKSPKH